MTHWYVEHLGFKVVRHREDPPHTRFLSDDTGRVVVELYTNPLAAITAFPDQHPLVFHLALVAVDARAECRRLEQAGAMLFLEESQADGSMLIMMRDPWGVPIQLCQRAQPF